jgi:hypothetical protein
MKSRQDQLRCIRLLIAIVIVGLIASGLSALPLLREVAAIDHCLQTLGGPAPVLDWIARIHTGLEKTYAAYPFVAYGTDWLAFGHFMIALFILGAFIDPVKNVWIIHATMIACLLVIPMALICGAARGIPFWWRAIDCSFGVIGFVPLFLAARLIRKLEQS